MYQNKRRVILKLAATALAMAGLGSGPALANKDTPQVENLGTFRFWTAWKSTENNEELCYISSQPQDSQPTNVNRGPIYFLVLNRANPGAETEAQALMGYPLDEDSIPQVSVDGTKTYDMVTRGSAAWLASAGDESALLAAMKAGAQMVVKGRSQRGTNTTDTYSLLGVTAAKERIDQACK